MRYKRVLAVMVVTGVLAWAGVASWAVVGTSRTAPLGEQEAGGAQPLWPISGTAS
jgi:hypothetical protein